MNHKETMSSIRFDNKFNQKFVSGIFVEENKSLGLSQ